MPANVDFPLGKLLARVGLLKVGDEMHCVHRLLLQTLWSMPQHAERCLKCLLINITVVMERYIWPHL